MLVYDIDADCIAVVLDRSANDEEGNVITCRALDGPELARLTVACDVNIATFRGMQTETMLVSLGRLRIILPGGMCLTKA